MKEKNIISVLKELEEFIYINKDGYKCIQANKGTGNSSIQYRFDRLEDLFSLEELKIILKNLKEKREIDNELKKVYGEDFKILEGEKIGFGEDGRPIIYIDVIMYTSYNCKEVGHIIREYYYIHTNDIYDIDRKISLIKNKMEIHKEEIKQSIKGKLKKLSSFESKIYKMEDIDENYNPTNRYLFIGNIDEMTENIYEMLINSPELDICFSMEYSPANNMSVKTIIGHQTYTVR